MRITLDVSPAVNGKAGLGRYAASLAKAVAAQRPGQVHLFANVAPGACWPDDLAMLPRTSVRAGYKPWRLAVLAGQIGHTDWSAMLPHPVLFHATEHLLIPLRSIPTVLTVHDLIYRLFPQHHKKLNYGYLNLAMPIYVRRADHVIAVSQATRHDLIRLYGTPAEKVTVVYEAAAPLFAPQPTEKIAEVRGKYRLPERYLITVGTIEPRKNLARLVEALAVLRRTDPDVCLVVVGAKGWLYGGFFDAIQQHRQQEAVILPGYVPDDDLPAMIAGAAVSVTASLYEGFGLPVLEAMACGAPVACSRTSSVGEIAGDAALTFDPQCVEEMVEAIGRVLGDAGLCSSLRERGFRRAAEFSWERAASETWAVYERVAAGW